MESPPISLWDFVGFRDVTLCSWRSNLPNHFCFSRLRRPSWILIPWHPVCSLNRQLTRLASRGGRNRSSTRLPVLGRQLRKRGLAPAPFSISRTSFHFPIRNSRAWHKEVPSPIKSLLQKGFHGWCVEKMSGRWGERPLGRGDGGYCNQKSVWAFRPFRCAREQQDDAQEQTGHNRCRTPESPANFRLLAQSVISHTFRR